MHLRHRVPTIFNIYMLDVICCALGCVILLWQVAHQEAEQQTAAAGEQAGAALKAKLQVRESLATISRLRPAMSRTCKPPSPIGGRNTWAWRNRSP